MVSGLLPRNRIVLNEKKLFIAFIREGSGVLYDDRTGCTRCKKELMVQFCTAYRSILANHHLIATGTTGRLVAEAAKLPVERFLPGEHGGDQQIAARVACDEVDMLLFFRDPITAKPGEPNEMNPAHLRRAQHPAGHQHRHGRGADPRPGTRRP